MRMRKKKWVPQFLEQEGTYLVRSIEEIPFEQTVYLEVGMGMGDFLVESALRHPEIFYLGLEKDETCIARAIRKAEEAGVTNLKVLLEDASHIDELFPGKSVDRIYLHFSDPWPKKRNHKRRLTYPTFLVKYETVLKDDGDIVYKSDNEGFFLDTLEYLKESLFEIVKEDRDYRSHETEEPMTAYERRFTGLGQPIYYLELKKKK